jgi:hypothetical protein
MAVLTILVWGEYACLDFRKVFTIFTTHEPSSFRERANRLVLITDRSVSRQSTISISKENKPTSLNFLLRTLNDIRHKPQVSNLSTIGLSLCRLDEARECVFDLVFFVGKDFVQ